MRKIENMLNEGGKGSNKYLIKNESEIAEWLGNKKETGIEMMRLENE